jgi:hypothetical protein
MCHLAWLLGRKYGTVWYHPASSKLWYLTALSFVNFQEKLTGTSPLLFARAKPACSACCVFGARCTFCVNRTQSKRCTPAPCGVCAAASRRCAAALPRRCPLARVRGCRIADQRPRSRQAPGQQLHPPVNPAALNPSRCILIQWIRSILSA